MQELENPPRVGLLGEWGGGRERAGVPPALGWVMVMFQSTQRWHCPLHRHPGCAMGSCKLCSASKSAGQRLMDVTATGWGCHHRGKMGFKLICCASTACTNLPSCSVSISFWPHFSMESRPKLLISGGSFTLPCQHPLLLLSFPEFAAIPSYLLTHSVLQLSSSSLLPKTFALTICRVDPALLQYLEKKNGFSATFFSQKLSAEMEFSLYEMLGLTESWDSGRWMCQAVKDLQSFTITAAQPWVPSGPLLRDSKPEDFCPNSLHCFPLNLLKLALIFFFPLKTLEIKIEEWLHGSLGLHWMILTEVSQQSDI